MANQRRTVLVTGAAGGIGHAMLVEFAACGDRLVAVDLAATRPEAVVAEFGSDHLGIACDLGSEAQIVDLFEQLDLRGVKVDVLMNNAAIGPTMAATLDTNAVDFKRSLRVNTLGPFAMAREAARRMTRGDVIVQTASLAGVLGNPRRNAYAASKAAMISMTKSLACEWAERGIRVNAVAPGYIRTPMVAALERDGKADLASVRQRIPMGRLGRADEVAAAAAFLASKRASYITGSVLVIDGGWMSFNQPGVAHPPGQSVPAAEVSPAAASLGPRCVVVVGGARGIGASIAVQFAQNGCNVVIADKDGEAASAVAHRLGHAHLGLSLDITSEQCVRDAFAVIGKRFGKIDVLVNDAAIADSFKPAFDQTVADLEAVLDVNLTGAFLCTREALRLMSKGGIVLNVGSINTFLPFAPRHAYGASKAAIDILTRCLAAELGPLGIRTATVAPGYIRTPGIAELERAGKIDAASIRRRIPLGDMGSPDDVAEAALFLASPAASYINGGILYVDGGWTSFGNAGNAN